MTVNTVDIHLWESSIERDFQWSEWGPKFNAAFPFAVIIAVLYVGLVFLGQHWMKNRKPFELGNALVWWNGFLTVLSWAMAIRLVPPLIFRIQQWSIAQSICDESFSDGTTGFWVLVFTVSKVPELLDTLFLVLRKKPVILLHWYHHCSVLLYNWWAFSVRMPAGLWFCGMNSFVHAFMYLYYFETARGNRPTWNVWLTLTQISQMVVGSYLTARDLLSEHCAPLTTTYTGVLMYFSYFCLFVHLFYDMYVKSGGRSRRDKSKSKSPAVIDGTSPTPAPAECTPPALSAATTPKKQL
jgi:elongation of very long chain fatty acids protein 6